MKKVFGFFFGAIALGAALWMWIGYLSAMAEWWGNPIAIIVAILFAPGISVFPFVYWYMEGVAPDLYFILLAVSIGSAMLAARFIKSSPE